MNSYVNALKALNFEELERVPVVFWAIGQNYAPFSGIPDNEYYQDPAVMLDAQLKFHEHFPDLFTVPGPWPDFGGVAELGAFGAVIEFPSNAPPQVRVSPLQRIEEVDNLVAPDPRKANFTSRILKYLAYFRQHLPREMIKDFGHLDGHMFCMGPGELSALMIGYEKFIYAMYDDPQRVHRLCRIVTDFLKDYLVAMMEIVGPAKRVIIVDHFPGMISSDTYNEYVHPYLGEVFDFIKGAEIRLYHNENDYPHLLNDVKHLNANVCHVGAKHDLGKDKFILNKCLMGNIHPISTLLRGSLTDIRKSCQDIIHTAGGGGGLWLSTAGGMAPETSEDRMELILEVAAKTSMK